MQERTKQFDALIEFLDQAATQLKEASVRDISRETTAFLVEGYAIGKAIGSLGKFFKVAHHKAVECAQKASKAAPEVVAINSLHRYSLRSVQWP